MNGKMNQCDHLAMVVLGPRTQRVSEPITGANVNASTESCRCRRRMMSLGDSKFCLRIRSPRLMRLDCTLSVVLPSRCRSWQPPPLRSVIAACMAKNDMKQERGSTGNYKPRGRTMLQERAASAMSHVPACPHQHQTSAIDRPYHNPQARSSDLPWGIK